MNTIVRATPASELPPSLGDAFEPSAMVEVSVRDRSPPEPEEDVLDRIARRHRFLEAHAERREADPVGGVRALRDEWG